MEANVPEQAIIENTISNARGLNEETYVVMGEAEYESLPTNKLSVHMMAGAAAGMAEHCIVYPVDCVKVIILKVFVRCGVPLLTGDRHCSVRDITIVASPHSSRSC